jgi:hypothetical protein
MHRVWKRVALFANTAPFVRRVQRMQDRGKVSGERNQFGQYEKRALFIDRIVLKNESVNSGA